MTLLLFLISLLSTIAWNDDFSSEAQSTTSWHGDWDLFSINANHQLQNRVDYASEAVLWHSSAAGINAEWSFFTRIYGGTSRNNLTRFYILDADSLNANGCFVQVGGTNHNITLYQVQQGQENMIIESEQRKNILSNEDAQVYVQLIRGTDGIFHLYSLVEDTDTDFMEEGTSFVNWLAPEYLALYVKNSSQRGRDMYFDDISVRGERQNEPLLEEGEQVILELSNDCLSLPINGGEITPISISYTCPDENYKAHLRVYSADGRLIRTCYKQEQLDRNGYLMWNGTDDKGLRVEIGVYVMILEITSPDHTPIRKRYTIAATH